MSRRDQIRMTEEEVVRFLDGRRVMNVASNGPDGHPHVVAMWYGYLPDHALGFWTYGRSQKIVNLRRDPRLTCLVEAGDTYAQLQGVELVGTASIVDDRDSVQALGESVYARYTGPVTDDVRPAIAKMGEKRVAVRIDVERTVSWDHTKLGGTY